MTITSGIVSIEDGTKAKEEFAPARKVRVELHFDIPEGVSDYENRLHCVAALADDKVNELLGRKVLSLGTVAVTSTAAAGKAVDGAKLAEGAKALTDKDKLAKAAGVLEEGKVEAPKKGPGRPKKTPEEPKPAPEQTDLEDFTSQPNNDPAALVEDPDDLTSVAPAKEISDGDLNDAVRARNKVISNSVKIRALIGSYNPDPAKAFTLKEIKQKDRQEFLDKLAALTKD